MSEEIPNIAPVGSENLQETGVLLAEQLPNIQAQVAELEAQFETQNNATVVEDDERFDRQVYDLGEGVSLTFRGREELPTFQAVDGGRKVTRGIVGIEERPKHTSGDRYGQWTMDMTDGEPYEDVFERAAESGSKEIQLIAPSTPQGMVGAALKLIEMGHGNPSNAPHLESLREALQDNEVTDEVLKLYDDIFVASTVDAKSPNMLGYTTVEDQPTGKVDSHGPMIVSRAIAGDSTGLELIRAKEAKLAAQEAIDEKRRRTYEKRTDEDAPIKQPGERLNPEELEVLKQAGFIGVHTTEANPAALGQDLRMLRPAAEFNKDDPNRSSRSTLHWSLNHAVISHMEGNFDNRGYTVVAPLEGLAEVNGSPAVLGGVDTYFTTSPGEGMLLPESAVVIHGHSDSDKPFIMRDGQAIELKTDNFTGEDLDQAIDYLTERYLEEHKQKGWDEGTARYAAQKRIVEALTEHKTTATHDLRKLLLSDEAKADMMPHEREISPHIQALYRAVQKGGVNLEDLARRMESGDRTAVFDEMASHTEKAAEDIIESGTISDYPELHVNLGDSLRRIIVNQTIIDMGGQVVRSDGQSAYIENDEFQRKEWDAARRIGIREGLHTYQPESSAEKVIDEQLANATISVSVPESPKLVEGPTRATADFDWTKFDSEPVWEATVGSRVPWAVRRQLIGRGLITYAQQKPDPNDKAKFGI